MTEPVRLNRRQLLNAAAVLGGSACLAPVLAACGSNAPPQNAADEAGYLTSGVRRLAGSDPDGHTVATATSAFGANLYQRLVVADDNLVISPWSVMVALAMARTGARGSTATEMDHVLGVAPAALGPGVDWLDRHLEGLAGTQKNATGKSATIGLNSANAVWGQRGEGWRPAFLDELARYYGSGLRIADFKHAAAEAAHAINSWVAGQTHDRIRDLVPADALDPLTRMVLVNALWFKAPWHEHFEKTATTQAPFTRADGSKVTVDMMDADLEASGYAEGTGWRAARIPYAGQQLAMTIVVPQGSFTLADLEKQLAGRGLAGILGAVRPDSVRVAMPRWTFRTSASLKPALSALGMPTSFGSRANFSGMTTAEQLFIRAVLHQGFIAVDEEGTEAAAATAVVMGTTSARMDPHVVRADRAFLFVIHDIATATPLFLGRVADPTAG